MADTETDLLSIAAPGTTVRK